MLPPSELIETRFFLFLDVLYAKLLESEEYHKFCNWKTIFCKTKKGALKYLLKLAGKHPYKKPFSVKLNDRGLLPYKVDLAQEIYFINYMRVVPSETMSTKEYKLCTVCINYLY